MREILRLIEESECVKEVKEELLANQSIHDEEFRRSINILDARLGAIMNIFRTDQAFSEFRGLTYNMVMLYLTRKKEMVVSGVLNINSVQLSELDNDFNSIYFDDQKMIIVIRATFENYYMGGIGVLA